MMIIIADLTLGRATVARPAKRVRDRKADRPEN
jgi:hypothetical protein